MNNQLTIINPGTIDIAQPEAFAQFVAQAKQLQGMLDEAWGAVEQQMLDRNVKKLSGDWGSISSAERINWKGNPLNVDPYYTKPALDTKKIRAAFDANEMPAGVDFTTSTYITKRIKA